MAPPFRPSGLRKHLPWLAGLFIAPFLFGSVVPEGQAILGLLFGAGLLLTQFDTDSAEPPLIPHWVVWSMAGLLILPLVPLPAQLIGWICPERFRLAAAFPVEHSDPPRWISLSLSPARTINRLWELSLVIASFVLARRAATASSSGNRALAWTVGIAIALQAAVEMWYHVNGNRSILGVWALSWGEAGGTFANRNHFANWIIVGALFCFGWLLRSIRLFQAKETSGKRSVLRQLDLCLLSFCIVVALCAAVASGSRGAALALLAGMIAWFILLRSGSIFHLKSLLALAGLSVVGIGLLLGDGDLLLERLGRLREDHAHLRLEIWRQALTMMLGNFALFGTGIGSFATAFNLYKTTGGDTTYWHAENDYVQSALELGLIGILLLSLAVFFFVRGRLRDAGQHPWKERELMFGIIAALAAFGVHALFDFPFQITANAVLAASLLGFLSGHTRLGARPKVPVPPGKIAMIAGASAALALLAAAVAQGTAFVAAEQARAERSSLPKAQHLEASLSYWPWNAKRSIRLLRTQVDILSSESELPPSYAAETFRPRLNRLLKHDPLNWELRLERAWFDLAFSTNQAQAIGEAWEAVKLNPQQAEIPLRFARFFVETDPDLALSFLSAAVPSGPKQTYDALALMWEIKRDTASLWEVTPNNPLGLAMLGEFAIEQKLFPLAAQAFLRLTNHLSSEELANRFTRAQRPDLALHFQTNQAVK